MSPSDTLVPIYTSRGDPAAFLAYPYIYDRSGEWIGWVTSDHLVYSVHGHYVGWLTKEPRILRKRSESFDKPRRTPPLYPVKIYPPATIPLAPLMAELSLGVIDVLDEEPDLLPSLDFGELREDLE
jgi:hypothetical protein